MSCILIVLKFDEIAFVIVMGSRQQLSLSECTDGFGCILMNGRMLSFAYDIIMCATCKRVRKWWARAILFLE